MPCGGILQVRYHPRCSSQDRASQTCLPPSHELVPCSPRVSGFQSFFHCQTLLVHPGRARVMASGTFEMRGLDCRVDGDFPQTKCPHMPRTVLCCDRMKAWRGHTCRSRFNAGLQRCLPGLAVSLTRRRTLPCGGILQVRYRPRCSSQDRASQTCLGPSHELVAGSPRVSGFQSFFY